MAVGINILSGSRGGEELGLDQPEFRAGDNPTYEIFFDPERDPGAKGRKALFRLGDDGWYLKNVGAGPLLVNGRQVEAGVRLRSGDVVRLSATGPEFSFKLLSQWPVGIQRLGCTVKPAPQQVSPAPAQTESHDRDAASSRHGRKWSMPTAVGLGTLAVLFAIYLLVRQPAASTDTMSSVRPVGVNTETSRSRTVASKSNAAPPSSGNMVPPGVAKTAPPGPAAKTDTRANEIANPKSPPTATMQDAARDAILLLLVEEPSSASAWPFGTATVIADRTLLTSATVATGLAGFRERGWKLWAINQRLGLKVPITGLRVHAGFVRAQGDPEKQIYVDLAILSVDEALPKQLGLASADELGEIDRGLPIICDGYLYENEPIDRFQTLVPEPRAGKIFVITSLPPLPGGPRLMHIRAELPGKMYGAPIVNESGHVLGVFAETAAPTPEQQDADLHLHYAPVADAAQIDHWTKDHDEQWWVPPIVTELVSPATK